MNHHVNTVKCTTCGLADAASRALGMDLVEDRRGCASSG